MFSFELFVNTSIVDDIAAAREALEQAAADVIALGLNAGKATQAEAEAGVNNSSWMTPLRTAQAIEALIPELGDNATFQQEGAGTVPLTVVQVLRNGTPFRCTAAEPTRRRRKTRQPYWLRATIWRLVT